MVSIRIGAQNIRVGEQKQARSYDADVTRSRLVENALHLFARHGFDGVTTRMLSSAANTNISSIAYHFGGKEGLYDAVFSQVRGDLQRTLTPAITSLNHGVALSGRDKAKLARVAREFIRAFFTNMLSDPRVQDRLAIVAREFARRSEGFGQFYTEAARPLQSALANLLSMTTGRPAESEETIVRAQCLIGQFVSFILVRQVLWTRLNWHGYNPDRIEMIVREATVMMLGALGLPDSIEASAAK